MYQFPIGVMLESFRCDTADAIRQAAKLGVAIDGATMYCTHQPCAICAKMLVNAGIIRVVYKHPYPDDFAKKIFDSVEIQIEQYK